MRHLPPVARLPRLAALLAALALLAAACGGSDSTAVDTGAADDGRPASFEDLDFSSPIGDLLGFDMTDQDAMEQEFQDMERRAEEVIASCMRDQGFEYTSRSMDTSIFVGGPFGGSDGLAYYSDEWVDKYGFGVSTQRFPQSEVGADLIGFDDESMPDMDDPGMGDPNQEYLEGLSDGEREAWDKALWGEPPDFSMMDEEDSESFMFEPEGCQGEAFEQVYNAGPGGDFDQQGFFESFGDELESMQERAESDPRVVEYRNRVADCVAEKGFVWDGTQQPWEYFEAKLGDIGRSGMMNGDPFEAAGVNPEEMSEREMEEFFAEMNRLSPEDRDKLAAVQAEELELARIVVDCDGGELNEQYFLGEIRQEMEQDFVDRNADEIATFANGS